MTVRLPLLLVVLVLSSVAVIAQDSARPRAKDLSWGAQSAGLRITLWTNPATDKVFVAVRNFSSSRICYCAYFGNNFTVYGRKDADSAWQELEFETPPEESVIVSIYNAVKLKPREEMPVYEMRNGARKKKTIRFRWIYARIVFPPIGAIRLKSSSFSRTFTAPNLKIRSAKWNRNRLP